MKSFSLILHTPIVFNIANNSLQNCKLRLGGGGRKRFVSPQQIFCQLVASDFAGGNGDPTHEQKNTWFFFALISALRSGTTSKIFLGVETN